MQWREAGRRGAAVYVYGNWTEQTIVSRSQPDEATGNVTRRKVTYY